MEMRRKLSVTPNCGVVPNLLLPRLLVMEALSSNKQLRRATTRSITPITPPTTAATLLPLRPMVPMAAILVPSFHHREIAVISY